MKTFIDWAAVKSEMESTPWEDDEDPYHHVRRVWLGTIYAMMPSGKAYQPFACSNLNPRSNCKGTGKANSNPDNPCPKCGGLGSREAWEDARFVETLEAEAERRHYSIDYGESGDDIYVEQRRDAPLCRKCSEPYEGYYPSTKLCDECVEQNNEL